MATEENTTASDAATAAATAAAATSVNDQETTDGFVSRLRVIEDQALEDRAAAFVQIHDELQRTLESGQAQHRHA